MNKRSRKVMRIAAALLGTAIPLTPVVAHHSYSMFDGTGTRTFGGTVTKLEWKNPHVFVWVYVPSKEHPGKYDLWSFANGSPSVLSGRGWNRTTLTFQPVITGRWS